MATVQTSSHPSAATGARAWEWLAAAALLALAAAGVWKLPRAGVAGWERHALTVVQAVHAQRIPLLREGADSGPLLVWLQGEGAPAPATLPGALAQQRAIGARHWERKGRRYSLLGLELDGASRTALVSTSADGRERGTATEQPRVERIGEWTMAKWTGPDVECLLLTDAPAPEITELLRSPPAAK